MDVSKTGSKYDTCCKMGILSFCLLLFPYFNVKIALEEDFIFNSTEIFGNITLIRGFGVVFGPPDFKSKPTDHTAIQIVIFAGCTLILFFIGLLLFRICCTERRRNASHFTRSPSLNSFQELIRSRLSDRPPTYYESQTNLNAQSINPPAYNEIINMSTQNSPVNVPTCPPIYTISPKMPTTYANNDLDLPYAECESDTDSPPSYHTSEGAVNPILLIANNSENNNESQYRREPSLAVNSEFYI